LTAVLLVISISASALLTQGLFPRPCGTYVRTAFCKLKSVRLI
jgi:hypothetical protein